MTAGLGACCMRARGRFGNPSSTSFAPLSRPTGYLLLPDHADDHRLRRLVPRHAMGQVGGHLCRKSQSAYQQPAHQQQHVRVNRCTTYLRSVPSRQLPLLSVQGPDRPRACCHAVIPRRPGALRLLHCPATSCSLSLRRGPLHSCGSCLPRSSPRFLAGIMMLMCMAIVSLPIAVLGGNFSTRSAHSVLGVHSHYCITPERVRGTLSEAWGAMCRYMADPAGGFLLRDVHGRGFARSTIIWLLHVRGR